MVFFSFQKIISNSFFKIQHDSLKSEGKNAQKTAFSPQKDESKSVMSKFNFFRFIHHSLISEGETAHKTVLSPQNDISEYSILINGMYNSYNCVL